MALGQSQINVEAIKEKSIISSVVIRIGLINKNVNKENISKNNKTDKKVRAVLVIRKVIFLDRLLVGVICH